MKEMEEASQQRHVVFFTHNEQSHITPMLALARLLSSRGLRVTCALPATAYASYISNNSKPSTLTHEEQRACAEAIQVEPVAESPDHASDDLMQLQQKLEDGLTRLMRCLRPPPSLLIADVLYFNWSQQVADRFGVPWFMFGPVYATTMLVACHLPELLQRGLLPIQPGMQDEVIDFIPGLMKGFRLADVPMDFLERSSAELEAFNFLEFSKGCVGVVLCNTSYALDVEAEAMDALVSLGLRIYAVAPMLHMDRCNSNPVLYCEDGRCLGWLDRVTDGCGVALPLMQSSTLRTSIGIAIQEVLHGERVGGAAIKQRIAQHGAAVKEAVGPTGISRRHLDQLVGALAGVSPS